MTWQPIETAPKDGTLILLCDNRLANWMLTAEWEYIPDGYNWVTPEGHGYRENKFTHWRPLPPAPETR